MSKPKPFCGSHSMETYKWMLALFCLVLAIEIAGLFLDDDDDDRPPDAAEIDKCVCTCETVASPC